MEVAVLIDYDNLSETQKVSGILDVATKVLMQLPRIFSATQGKCDIRIYGGWYEEENMTLRAQQLSVSIQSDFPAIIRVPMELGKQIIFKTNAELARALVEEPSHYLFNTYRKKSKPANIRVLKPEDAGCTNVECSLPVAKKLLKTGKCSAAGCTTSRADLVYRDEQKIVDTMLTCDLLYYSKLGYNHIMLVSGDDDFLPPIRTAILRGSKVYRVHPTPSNHRASIHIAGTQLVELEL
jgi:uncharacterized LabA/DUF88 family protein